MAKRALVKAVPTFTSERAEREYWETHDTGDVVDIRSNPITGDGICTGVPAIQTRGCSLGGLNTPRSCLIRTAAGRAEN